MRLTAEFLQLPLRFDAQALAREVAQLDAAEWRPHPQGHPGNFALPLVAAGGDPSNDETRGPMRPTPVLSRCPLIRRAMGRLDAVVGRSRLMRLEGHAEATPHTDTNYYWQERYRVHVPIVTTPDVEFRCGERSVHMAAGEVWVFDTWRPHNVLNRDGTPRIHLVVDTVGSPAFARLIAAARDPFGAAPSDWRADPVAFDATEPALRFETSNHPVVMDPWELDRHVERVLDDLVDRGTPAAAAAIRAIDTLRAAWRAAWAEHAAARTGWPTYGALLGELDRALAALGGAVPLKNGVDAAEALRQFVVRAALNPALADAGTSAELRGPVQRVAPGPRRSADPLDAPVFIVSPPRSGSSLLFETLAQSPDFASIGGESHAVIEGIAPLHPAQRMFDSNRLTARDATPDVVAALRERFRTKLADRDGRAPGGRPLRLLEKTPKNALRVPFLAAAFPEARFVYLYRDARETLSSMLDAWKSRRFVTYPEIPGWSGAPWSLLLTPGWRALRGAELAEVVAHQWQTCVRILLDDLENLEPDQWCVASYDALVERPQQEIGRLCEFLGVAWDRELTAPLPNSRHTLSSPVPEKWRRNAAELEPVMHRVAAQANRAHRVFATPPATRAVERRRRRPEPAAQAGFRSVHTTSVVDVLSALGSSLVVSTYQSGRLILARVHDGALNTHFRAFPSPMGIARDGNRLALGTQRTVWTFADQGSAASGDVKGQAPRNDACFVPLHGHVTGDVRVHELAFAGEELWVVNTRFSCLATLDARHSFVPRWRPRFVSGLAAEDRCHLNGLAVRDGRPRYVTALGRADTAQGWRERKLDGGLLIDVDNDAELATGLCMPHSPRWYVGKLWVLESGKGTLSQVDPESGRVDAFVELPGFTRGLAFAGRFAFVGLSQVRESVFHGIPLARREKELQCGVWVVDLAQARIVGFLRFEGDVQEIFDVQVLAGLRNPEIFEPEHERVAGAFLLPADALSEVVA